MRVVVLVIAVSADGSQERSAYYRSRMMLSFTSCLFLCFRVWCFSIVFFFGRLVGKRSGDAFATDPKSHNSWRTMSRAELIELFRS